MNWTSILFPLWLFRPRFLLVLFFLAAGALMIAFNYSYSDGNRAGYIQKFSNEGLGLQDPRGRTRDDHGAGHGAGSMGIYRVG